MKGHHVNALLGHSCAVGLATEKADPNYPVDGDVSHEQCQIHALLNIRHNSEGLRPNRYTISVYQQG